MRVVLFGASGMVGQAVLFEALDAPEVTQVLSVGRSKTGRQHPKLVEVVQADFTDLSALIPQMRGYDACFFCLGVSAVGMSEADYSRVTYDFTLAAAKAMHAASPNAAFVYVSGVGTDPTGKGRTMWARVKGRTENAILGMGFGAAYAFRPGLILPERGITSRTKVYRFFYAVTKPFAGLMARSESTTTTSAVGHAMLELAASRPAGNVVEPRRINELAEAWRARAR